MWKIFKGTKKVGELDEIISHVEQLKAKQEKVEEDNKNDLEVIKKIQDNTGKIAGETSVEEISSKDVFEIVGTNEILEERISKMNVDMSSSSVCDICGQEMVFEENLSGLTIHGKYFTCEKCCKDASKETLEGWVNYKQAKPEDMKPIALWIMQENNRTQLFD